MSYVSIPHIATLIKAVILEEKEQNNRYGSNGVLSVKALKAEGWPCIRSCYRKNFGYADYPEISFRLNFPAETIFSKMDAAIECFYR